MRVTLRAKGQITLPEAIRRTARLNEGDLLEAKVTEDGAVVLRPLSTVDRAQAWFWTPEWQAGEREASEQVARGEGTTYESDEAFLESLK